MKIIATASLFLTLTACGFTPVNLQQTQTPNIEYALAAIEIEPSQDKITRHLGIKLQDLLNPMGVEHDKKYSLTLNVSKTTGSAVVQYQGGTVSRYNAQLSVNYILRDLEKNREITQGMTDMVSSYDSSDSPYANFVGDNSATNNNITELAEEVRKKLIAVLAFEAAR